MNPNYPDARIVYAQVLRITGRGSAALEEVQRGLDGDPHNAFFQQQFALQLFSTGRAAEATERLQTLLAAQPRFPPAHQALWSALYKQGRYEDALSHAKTFFGAELGDVLTRGYADGGYPGAMRRAAERLVKRAEQRYVAPVLIARFYAHAGDSMRALEWLEKRWTSATRKSFIRGYSRSSKRCGIIRGSRVCSGG